MRITEKLKKQIKIAERMGYDRIVVTKGGNWNVPAIVEIPFVQILNAPNSTDFDSGDKGVFVSKERPFPPTGIGYYSLMRLKPEDAKKKIKH